MCPVPLATPGSFQPGCPWHVLSTPPTSDLVPGCGPLLSCTTCHLMPVSRLPRDPGSCPPFYLMFLGGLGGAAWLPAPTMALPRQHLKTRLNKSVATECKCGFELPGSQSKMGNEILLSITSHVEISLYLSLMPLSTLPFLSILYLYYLHQWFFISPTDTLYLPPEASLPPLSLTL